MPFLVTEASSVMMSPPSLINGAQDITDAAFVGYRSVSDAFFTHAQLNKKRNYPSWEWLGLGTRLAQGLARKTTERPLSTGRAICENTVCYC